MAPAPSSMKAANSFTEKGIGKLGAASGSTASGPSNSHTGFHISTSSSVTVGQTPESLTSRVGDLWSKR